jgi:cytochrome bd ubiquinol oxidase subunit II
VLWLLIVRGLSIEFRAQWANPLWRAFLDASFALASTVLALVLGASLGNILRGVPIGSDGELASPLFTDFSPHGYTGALDWYTLSVGTFAVIVLFAHGCAYLTWKTEGDVQARARAALRRTWPIVTALVAVITLATCRVQPALLASLAQRPWAWPLALAIVVALVGVWLASGRGRDRAAFFASSALLAALLLATAASLFPVILRSTIDAQYDVTAYGAATGRRGLLYGLTWWIPALLLAVAYFWYLFRSFAGKVRPSHY